MYEGGLHQRHHPAEPYQSQTFGRKETLLTSPLNLDRGGAL